MKVRVLLLNWRDVRSPRGGGAERVTHEVALRLVERGHSVTWLSSAAPGLAHDETIDGVRVVRRGSEATTRFHVPSIAREIAPDVILEEINTLPYLAPLWARVPVVLYMNQLARDVWWYEAPWAAAVVGWLAEPMYLQAYRGCDVVTISASSRDDLRRLGMRRTITIAPMAVEASRVSGLTRKTREGRMIAIGRLAPSKRYDHAIEALVLLRAVHPRASLTIVGDGRERESLEQLAQRAGVRDVVHLAGFVTKEEKRLLLDASDILVGTSVREGWGLTVTEAATRGVPAVVYDIPGYRDAVIPDRTGLLVRPNPEALARGVAELVGDESKFEQFRENAWKLVKPLSFEATASAFEEALLGALSRSQQG